MPDTPPLLTMPLRDVEDILATRHSVADARRSAFAGRLKHYQRSGFPPGTNTGRGKPANYGPGEVLLLAVAFELNEFGVTPDRAMRSVLASVGDLAIGTDAILDGSGKREGIVCNIAAAALADLREEPDEVRPLMMGTINDAKVGLQFIEQFGFSARVALFSLDGLIYSIANVASGLRGDDDFRDAFLASLLLWAKRTIDGNP